MLGRSKQPHVIDLSIVTGQTGLSDYNPQESLLIIQSHRGLFRMWLSGCVHGVLDVAPDIAVMRDAGFSDNSRAHRGRGRTCIYNEITL